MVRKRRILVVEDDETIALGLKTLLETEGYRVRVVHDGQEALTQEQKFHADMLLLDVNIPRLSGFQVCSELRSRGYRGLVFMLTARTDQADRMRGLDGGADDYITKPFDTREVLARVRAHFRELDRLQHHSLEATAERQSTRRLLAIMFTDMKDFSKRMNEDEGKALAMLKRHNAILTQAVARHSGKIVEITGDAFMVAFENVLQAVKTGLDVQRKLKRYNTAKVPRDRIQVRMGIHVGDVILDAGKLRGDTINIAARLQQMAPPGRVLVSTGVVEATKNKLRVNLTRLGVRRFKNITQPIVVYRVTV